MNGHSGAGTLYYASIPPRNYVLPVVLAAPFQAPYPVLFISIASCGTMGNEYVVFISGSWLTGPKTLEISRVMSVFCSIMR